MITCVSKACNDRRAIGLGGHHAVLVSMLIRYRGDPTGGMRIGVLDDVCYRRQTLTA